MNIAACRPTSRKSLLHCWGAVGLLLMLLLLVLKWQLYGVTTRVFVAPVSRQLSRPQFIRPDTNTGQEVPVVRSKDVVHARYEPTPEAIPGVPGTGSPGSLIRAQEDYNARVK